MGKEDTPSDERFAFTHSDASLRSGESGTSNSSATSYAGIDELKADNEKKRRKSPFIFKDDEQKVKLVEIAISNKLWRKQKQVMYSELAKAFNEDEKLGVDNNNPPVTSRTVSRAFIDIQRVANEEIKNAGGDYTAAERKKLPQSTRSMICFLRNRDRFMKLKKGTASFDSESHDGCDVEDISESEDKDLEDGSLRSKPDGQDAQEKSQDEAESEEGQAEGQAEVQPHSTQTYPQAPPGIHIGPYPFPHGPPQGPPQGPAHGVLEGPPQGPPHGLLQGPPQGPPQGHQGYTPILPHPQAQKHLGQHEQKGPMFNNMHFLPPQHQIPSNIYPQLQHQGVYPTQQPHPTENTDFPAVVYNAPIVTGPPQSTSEHGTGTEGDRNILIRRIAGAVTDFEANLTQRLAVEATSSKNMVDNWQNSMKYIQDDVNLLHKEIGEISSKLDTVLELLNEKK